MNVLRRLTEKGYKIFVIASLDQYIHYRDAFPGLTHIPLNHLSRKSTNPWKDIQLTLELLRIYRRVRPDVLLHYTSKPNIFGGMAARILGIPSVAVVTGLGYAFIHKGMIREITILLYRLTSRFHRKFIFENQDDLSLMESLRMIRQGQGISIKGCGVNVRYFSPAGSEKEEEEIIFTFIGRLLYDKGLKEFVQAAKKILEKHEKVRFWIAGNFDYENPTSVPKSVFNGWLIKDKLEYKGFQNDIRDLIARSACIVLPSYREAIARALTEAMAMEKPVITTDTPGCNEAVEEGYNGILVPVRNSHALADAFERFIDLTPDQRIKMGKNGREKVLNEFDDTLIANQIVDIVESVMD
jgi:glycosyltransferase involved in cell wall biosynthesis